MLHATEVGLSWRRVPWLTLALILANVGVFYGVSWDAASVRPRSMDPATWLSTSFLHANTWQLAINMLFLLIVGGMLEPVMGRVSFLAFFGLGALGASAVGSVALPGAAATSQGASGAVSALIGMSVVLHWHRPTAARSWGGRRYPIVLALLLAWLLARGLVAWWQGSRLTIAVDIGGLLIGMALALAGLALYRIETPDDLVRRRASPSRNQALLADHASHVSTARRLTGELDFEGAAAAWREAAKLRPHDADTLRQWFNLTKLWPDRADFHHCARLIFSLPEEDAYTATLQHATYRAYMELAQPGPRLNANTMANLVQRFTRLGEFADAERLCRTLVRKAPTHGATPEALVCFVQALAQAGRIERARLWLPELKRLPQHSALVQQIEQRIS